MNDTAINMLNEKQQKAVLHAHGPSIILAGAGSGKTRVLVQKVLQLIEKESVPPSSIVMITFTNKAAKEMKERIQRAVGADISLGYVGTFHSFCCRLLRIEGHHIDIDHNFTIYDDNDQFDLIKAILKKMDTKKFTPSYFVHRISQAKNQIISPERYIEVFADYGAALTAEVYFQYQKELQKNHALDFDDLIIRLIYLLQSHPEVLEKYQEKYRYLLVDEFQDTNSAQYELTRILGSKYHNVTVVGDFSQSIYSWRGADIQNLKKFEENFPQTLTFHLEQNYRSTQAILSFAYDVISKNQTHPVLELFTENGEGEEIEIKECVNEEEEARFVAREIEDLESESESTYSDFAVLYRTNAQSRIIEELFLRYGIPYTLIGGTRFYERKEIKDVLSYLRLMLNPQDSMAMERIKKLGKGRFEKYRALHQRISGEIEAHETNEIMELIFSETGYLETYDAHDEEDYGRLENIKELKSVAVQFPKLGEFLEQVALVESEYFEGEKNGNSERVRLMTLHQAKGLEFSYVFITGVEEGILPHSRSTEDLFQLEEERRLLYVGITRARRKLYLSYAKRRFIFGRPMYGKKSRFISDEDENNDPTNYW
ncbi:UvrD-helicase domain-containing protein [Candidatus Roizmanbacteria bacterium]|nr:UvrD-helicase domain-containing protein [Candidatus Roizmanbacteria bacterium]